MTEEIPAQVRLTATGFAAREAAGRDGRLPLIGIVGERGQPSFGVEAANFGRLGKG